MTRQPTDPNDTLAAATAGGDPREIHGQWTAAPAENTVIGAKVEPEGVDSGTTHADYGSGDPRLVLVGSTSAAPDGVAPPAVAYPLNRERTTIGSAADADIPIPGVAGICGEVVHTDDDEYVLFVDDTAVTSGEPNIILNGRPGHILRSGAQVRYGDYELVFERAEFADHGRPYGGREGGEFEHQRQQVDPRPVLGDGVPSYEEEQ